MSHITVTGNLTADPQFRRTQDGRSVVEFTLIENRRTRNGDTYQDAEPNAFRVEAWASLAENINASLTKGSHVSVTGAIQTDRWNDKETGEPRTAQRIVASDVAHSLRFHTVTAIKNLPRTQGDAAPAGSGDAVPIPTGDTPF